jgi:outer membrane protein TolC
MRRAFLIVIGLAAVSNVPAFAEPLTADGAVKIALQRSTQMIQANASVLDAKGGLWSAYSGILPRVNGSVGRSGSFTEESSGSQAFGGFVTPATSTFDSERYSGSTDVSGSWSILSLSSWTSWSAARQGMRAANHGRAATRADVVLSTKRQFYEVVKAMHLARVSAQALRLARDDERRVNALYEVGSVSKSDLLKARVRTAQSELDSLVANHAVTSQRIALASQLGIPEAELAEVDSTLSAVATPADFASVLADARAARPDLKSAEASLKAAELSLRSARFARLPYVTLSGSWTPTSRSSSKFFRDDTTGARVSSFSSSESQDAFSGQVAVNLDLFDGLATEGRVSSAKAGVLRARENRDALVRNLESEVRQTLLAQQEAIEREALARRTVESAGENLNLVQQKYNVGSATILDLIDSQVQFQSAQSSLVSALAAIRVAEASLDRVRGRAE